jgi:hypothetical protein
VSALPTGTSGSLSSLEKLCSLECVKRAADASAVVWVLDSTMACSDAAELHCNQAQADELLLQLPSAADISQRDLARLMAGVLQQCYHVFSSQNLSSSSTRTLRRPGLLQALCTMPAMEQLTSAMIQDVLQTAFMPCNRVWSVLQWLVPLMWELPGASCMQLSSMLQWLQLALARPSKEVVGALCSSLDSDATGSDLTEASIGSSGAQALLASTLPAGRGGCLSGLGAVCSLQRVRHAAVADTVASEAAATELPEAAQLTATELARLLTCVLQRCYASVGQLPSNTPAVLALLQALHSMPAMKNASCDMIQDILSTGFQLQHRL